MSKNKATIEPYSTMDHMWGKVLRDARITVGKSDTGKIPSENFKKSIMKSQHTPIRALIFEVFFPEIPSHITQQFSRHHIAMESNPNVQWAEDIKPTDMEHSVKTSRGDRTGVDRHERRQDDPVMYRFRSNAKGLIDASKKRLCLAADIGAVEHWRIVKEGIKELCPELAFRMQPECICQGFCGEDKNMVRCKYSETEKWQKIRSEYIK